MCFRKILVLVFLFFLGNLFSISVGWSKITIKEKIISKSKETNRQVRMDINSELEALESKPREHFLKAMELISSNPLNASVVGKELKLEIELIADGDALAFATSFRDIANVIEYVNWNSVQPRVLAKFYQIYKLDLLEQKHDGELDTLRVKRNLKKIPYTETFVRDLASLKNGGTLAYNYLTSIMFEDCKAIKYVIKNNDFLDIPIDIIQDAQATLINKCDFSVARKSLKELLKIAKRDLNAVKVLIEKRLTHRLPCNDYNDFLKYNINDITDFNVDYERLNEQCSQFPVISINLAYQAYNQELYDKAYKFALKSCRNEDHPSKGCELLAHLIMTKKATKSLNLTNNEIMKEAIGFLTTGHEEGDIKSTANLFDIFNSPILFSIYSNKKNG